MTVKIDRFQIKENCDMFKHGNPVCIIDFLKYESIADFTSDDKELNLKLAKIVLDELNKEFKE